MSSSWELCDLRGFSVYSPEHVIDLATAIPWAEETILKRLLEKLNKVASAIAALGLKGIR